MGKIIIYQPDNESNVSVKLEGNTVWLTQKQLSEILGTSTDNISLHLKNIYASGELLETATAEDFSVVQQEGKRSVSRKIKHFNLDAIISVGYRVNSKRGTQFRQWATILFVDFLNRNDSLIRNDQPVINDIGLAALALLIAESAPAQKKR